MGTLDDDKRDELEPGVRPTGQRLAKDAAAHDDDARLDQAGMAEPDQASAASSGQANEAGAGAAVETGGLVETEADTGEPDVAPEPACCPEQPEGSVPDKSAPPRHHVQALFIAIAVIAVIIVVLAVIIVRGISSSKVTEQASQSDSASQDANTEQAVPEPDVPAPMLSAPSEQTLALRDSVADSLVGFEDGVAVTFLNVTDPTDGFEINGDAVHTSASMIKLLIMADLLQQVRDGAVSFDTPVTMDAEDIVGGSGDIQGMAPGTVFTIDELATYMIAASDNTATNMLIDILGMDSINAEAQALGLTGTSLERKMMDTEAQAEGRENRISSNDAAKILQLVATGQLIDQEMSDVALGYLESQTIDAGLAAGVSDPGVVVAHKTGELDGVENDGGIVFASSPYVLVVLTEGIPNGTGNSLIQTVSELVFSAVGSDMGTAVA